MSHDRYIELLAQPGFWLGKQGDDSDTKYRLGLFQAWLKETGQVWMNANLAEFRDDLLRRDFATSSVGAIMGTLRQRIRSFTNNNEFNDWFIRTTIEREGVGFETAELMLQNMVRRISNIADARNSTVKQIKVQDESDEQRLWLNGHEEEFLENITEGKPELVALRDRALAALIFASGARREEITNLVGEDLVQRYQRQPALMIRHGKGDKQRLVVYGDLWDRYMSPYVMPWLDIVGGYEEPFFQGFWSGNKKLRGRPLNVATVNAIIASSYIEVDGKSFTPSPHDLRRTYARDLFQTYSMKIEAIQEQMGHVSIATTRHYIGKLDVSFRTPQKQG